MMKQSEIFEIKTRIFNEINNMDYSTVKLFSELLEILIEQNHLDNEKNSGDDFIITQGRISQCRDLLTLLQTPNETLERE